MDCDYLRDKMEVLHIDVRIGDRTARSIQYALNEALYHFLRLSVLSVIEESFAMYLFHNLSTNSYF